MEDRIINTGGGGVSFQGENAVEVFRAITLAAGLRLYARTGMKPNRAWTPTAMLREANRITGHHYRRGQYTAASLALSEWAERQRDLIQSKDRGCLS